MYKFSSSRTLTRRNMRIVIGLKLVGVVWFMLCWSPICSNTSYATVTNLQMVHLNSTNCYEGCSGIDLDETIRSADNTWMTRPGCCRLVDSLQRLQTSSFITHKKYKFMNAMRFNIRDTCYWTGEFAPADFRVETISNDEAKRERGECRFDTVKRCE